MGGLGATHSSGGALCGSPQRFPHFRWYTLVGPLTKSDLLPNSLCQPWFYTSVWWTSTNPVNGDICGKLVRLSGWALWVSSVGGETGDRKTSEMDKHSWEEWMSTITYQHVFWSSGASFLPEEIHTRQATSGDSARSA